MTTEPLPDIAAQLLLTSGREQMRAVLGFLALIPPEHRPSVRAGCIQALGAIEEALGVERTFPKREVRRQVRDMERVG